MNVAYPGHIQVFPKIPYRLVLFCLPLFQVQMNVDAPESVSCITTTFYSSIIECAIICLVISPSWLIIRILR